MIVVVFRSRIQPGVQQPYSEAAQSITAAAIMVPGYVSHKEFTAEDGESVIVAEYESEEALMEWACDPRHMAAKKVGRQNFFVDYKIQICSLLRERSFSRGAGGVRK